MESAETSPYLLRRRLRTVCQNIGTLIQPHTCADAMRTQNRSDGIILRKEDPKTIAH